MKAIDYIRKGWCQGAFARNAKGESKLSTDPGAVQWCSYGAIYMAYKSDEAEYDKAIDKVLLLINESELAVWNDAPERTREDVIEIFEIAGI